MGGTRQVVGLHVVLNRLDQQAGLGQQIAVQQTWRVGPHLGSVAVDVGVQGEKSVGAPDGQQHLAHHVVDAIVGNPQVAASHDGRRHQVPAQGVRALVVEDGGRLGVVPQLFGQLGAVLSQQDPVADDVLKGRQVEQSAGQDMEGVEPTAGLVDVLHDEVGWEVFLEPLPVLERVMHLGERHGARLEPAVQDLGDSTHGGPASRVVRVGSGQLVDEWPVEVVRPDPEVPLDLVQAAVDVYSRVLGVVAAPDGDG